MVLYANVFVDRITVAKIFSNFDCVAMTNINNYSIGYCRTLQHPNIGLQIQCHTACTLSVKVV